MAQVDADRNLLFGVLALQDDLIDARQLAEACTVWALRKDVPLGDVLVERGWIAPADRDEVDRRVARKVRQHGGDVHQTLGALADGAARDAIRQVDDTAIRRSLSTLPPAAGYVLIETVLKPAERRGRYTLSRLHAEGGLGQVWVARDADLNRDVALKQIRPAQATHPEAWRRFLREAQVTGQLEHPSIVPVYELARRPEDDQPFYTMRFVRGRTMREAIADYHRARVPRAEPDPLELPRLLQAFVSVCQAIGYAHSRGVVHRDLKPENVVLGGFGEVIVLDWGLAKMVDRPDEEAAGAPAVTDDAQVDATVAGSLVGTPAYMAPEQAEGRLDLIDARTDIYGLGGILYETLTGSPPHVGHDTADVLGKIRQGNVPTPRSVVPSVPPALEAICLRALARQRGERYATAVDLAADVQRWLADEPVSAYREPLARRVRRFAKRHRQALQVAAAAVFVVAVSLLLLARAERAQRLYRLLGELDHGIEAADWSPARLDALEATVQALGRLDRAQGVEGRHRMDQAFARAIGESMDRAPKLDGPLVARVKRDLEALAARAPALELPLRRNLELRLGRTETDSLNAPFESAAVESFFDPAQVRVEGDGLARRPASPGKPSDTVSLRLACPGDARLAATFDDRWSTAPAVGLVLDANDGQGYRFLVSVPGFAERPPGPVSRNQATAMEQVRAAGGRLDVVIVRNGLVQARTTIDAPGGPLRLEVARQAERVTFQVNAEQPLVHDDPFPIGAGITRGFGIDWPAGVKLRGLLCERRRLPGRPSPLERGDELFGRGEFASALAAYQEQERARSTTDATLGQEIQYKRALCLLKLGRADEGAALLTAVMAGLTGASPTETRWPLRAACALWLLRTEQQRASDADEVVETLAPTYSFEQLALLIPAHHRALILDRYRQSRIWGTVAWRPEGDVTHIERALRVQDLLNADAYDRRMTKWRLVDALRVQGDDERALKELRSMLRDPGLSTGERIEMLRDFTWMRINQGEEAAREALGALDQWLTDESAGPAYRPLLIERARAGVRLGRWVEAEADCERFFAEVDRAALHYAELADACVLRGFLRAHRGNHAGAQAAWREGLIKHWDRGIPALSRYRPLDRIGLRRRADAVTWGVLVGSLTGSVSEDEAGTFFEMMINAEGDPGGTTEGIEIFPLVRKLSHITAYLRSIMLDEYTRPEDIDYARRMAFRQVSFRDYIVVGLVIGVKSAVRVGTYPDGVPAPLEPTILAAVEGLFKAYDSKAVRDADIKNLVILWMLPTLSPSSVWKSVASQLEPGLRAPLAFGMGRRFVVRGSPRAAIAFFHDALENARGDAVLERYIREELTRLEPAPGGTDQRQLKFPPDDN